MDTLTPPFTSAELCKMSGLTYRQLDYAVRRGRITPSVRRGTGSGTQRLWSIGDLGLAKRAAMNLSFGFTADASWRRAAQ